MKEINIENIKESFLENIKGKILNTFISTFIIAFIIEHWRLILIILNFEKDCTYFEKIAIINDYLDKNISFCKASITAFLTLFFIIFILFFNTLAKLIFDSYNKIVLSWITNFIDKKEIPTKEVFIELKLEKENIQSNLIKTQSDFLNFKNDTITIRELNETLKINSEVSQKNYEEKIQEISILQNKERELIKEINSQKNIINENEIRITNLKLLNDQILTEKIKDAKVFSNILNDLLDIYIVNINKKDKESLRNAANERYITDKIFDGKLNLYHSVVDAYTLGVENNLSEDDVIILKTIYENEYKEETIIFELSTNLQKLFDYGYIKQTESFYINEDNMKHEIFRLNNKGRMFFEYVVIKRELINHARP